jgi:hypothetical protein
MSPGALKLVGVEDQVVPSGDHVVVAVKYLEGTPGSVRLRTYVWTAAEVEIGQSEVKFPFVLQFAPLTIA